MFPTLILNRTFGFNLLSMKQPSNYYTCKVYLYVTDRSTSKLAVTNNENTDNRNDCSCISMIVSSLIIVHVQQQVSRNLLKVPFSEHQMLPQQVENQPVSSLMRQLTPSIWSGNPKQIC